jgi:hypothetical protein
MKPKFVVSVSPLPGESLASVVARAAYENLFTNPANIFLHLNMPMVHLGSIATRYAKHCDDLAYLVGSRPDDLRTLFYKRVDRRISGFGAEIEVLGSHLALRCRESKVRRLSPASLCRSAHHRTAWELRFLHWCPESFEYLISDCTMCGKGFGWHKLAGVHICENCGADVREQISEYLLDHHRETARLLSDLVLERKAAARIRAALHEDLRHLVDIDLLCLALMLACSFEWSPKMIHNALYDMDRTSAPSLEMWRIGFDRMRRWPESAYEIVWKQMETPREDAGYGMIEELGPVALHLMPVNADLAKTLRKMVSDSYRRKGVIALRPIGNSTQWRRPGWLPSSEAKKKHTLTDWTIVQALGSPDVRKISHEGGKRSPTLIHEEDLLRWTEKLKAAFNVRTAMKRIGIPEHALWELIEIGYLKLLTSEERTLTPRKGFIDAKSVQELGEDLFSRCSPVSDNEGLVPLSEAVASSLSPLPPWVAAISAILKGTLRAWRHDAPSPGYVDGLHVRPDQFDTEVSRRSVVFLEFREAPLLMTYGDAAALLGISPTVIVQLTKTQKIVSESGGPGQRAVRRSVYAYAMEHPDRVKQAISA